VILNYFFERRKFVMKRAIMLVLSLMVLLSIPAMALAVEVVEGVIATQVTERSPVGAAESFSSDVGRLYCFTRIAGAAVDSQVTHVWLKDGQEKARVPLTVRSNDYRTWSSKAIMPEWTGAWQVDVLAEDGTLLKSLPFTVQ
jgi:hypothetical protein